MTKRKAIPKSVRFEVFKRDSFTCQYCGRAAPDVILELDHILPVSKGGENDITNLITSCKACIQGKGARTLDDDAVLAKQKAQLDELQERREQLEMMMEWQRGLISLGTQTRDELAKYWSELVPGYHLNEKGLRGLDKLIKRYSIKELCEAMRKSASQYLEFDAENKPIQDTVEKTWEYVRRICSFERRNKDKPYLKNLYYIRGIMRRRWYYVSDRESIEIMERAYLEGMDTDEIKSLALDARNWTEWRGWMLQEIDAFKKRQSDGQ